MKVFLANPAEWNKIFTDTIKITPDTKLFIEAWLLKFWFNIMFAFSILRY